MIPTQANLRVKDVNINPNIQIASKDHLDKSFPAKISERARPLKLAAPDWTFPYSL